MQNQVLPYRLIRVIVTAAAFLTTQEVSALELGRAQAFAVYTTPKPYLFNYEPSSEPQDLVPGADEVEDTTTRFIGCKPYLDEFISNTEYLGPLGTYVLCSGLSGLYLIPAEAYAEVFSFLEKAGEVLINDPTYPVTKNLQETVRVVAARCSITVNASSSADGTRFTGTTDCTTGWAVSSVSGQAKVVDYLFGSTMGTGTSFSAARVGTSEGIAYIVNARPVKIKYLTSVLPPWNYCGDIPNCALSGLTWVVIPPKNVSTAARLSCSSPVADRLDCEIDSAPFTAEAVIEPLPH